MMIKRFSSWLTALILIVSLVACNLPIGQEGGVTTPDIDATIAAEVAIAQAIQTKVAQTMAANAPAALPGTTSTITSTITNTVEALPQITFTPTLTPTNTLTPTPEGVTLVVSQDTYCRFGGPYSSFRVITTVRAGQVVEVISRNPENDSYFVKNPYEANSTCWMYGRYATLTGNAAGLAVSTMHPTPTPTATPTPNMNFTVAYSNLETCLGSFAFKLLIRNTGGTIWQYEQITGSDSNTAFVISHSSNTFDDYSGCVPGLSQADLTPGEQSYILNLDPGQFGYDPTGNQIFITVKLCSQDGGAGACLSKDLSFTP